MTTLGDTIARLQRAYPRHGPARFLHAKPADLRRSGKAITVYLLIASADGRVSVHQTVFDKSRARSVAEWADWLTLNLDEVVQGNVLAFINRRFGSIWRVEKVLGWHFTRSKRRE